MSGLGALEVSHGRLKGRHRWIGIPGRVHIPCFCVTQYGIQIVRVRKRHGGVNGRHDRIYPAQIKSFACMDRASAE